MILINANAIRLADELSDTYDAIKDCTDAVRLASLCETRDILKRTLQTMLDRSEKITRKEMKKRGIQEYG